MESRLAPLQRDLLQTFFRRAPGWFLSGGAALAGFHLGHRTTEDLDLFVAAPHLDEGGIALRAAVDELGATLEALTTGSHHRRFLVRRGAESVVVDLVHDPVPQIVADKPVTDGIPLDPPQEILANKLCALLSRSELRDLVDVRALEQAGFAIEEALPLAARKDGGFSPATLAWTLKRLPIAPDARGIAGLSAAELKHYRDALCDRLARLARPR